MTLVSESGAQGKVEECANVRQRHVSEEHLWLWHDPIMPDPPVFWLCMCLFSAKKHVWKFVAMASDGDWELPTSGNHDNYIFLQL